ncbi:MAG: DUF2064 domain-containing protein [Neptuniibacter sp.]
MQTEPVTLLIFCKQPKLHQGKQRLACTIGAENALSIADALLQCALEDALLWDGPVVLSPSHPDQVAWTETLLPEAELIVQPEGNLGDRINAVDRALRDQGHNKIVIIGTDAPVLSQSYFCEVISTLGEADIVMSSASDGGVTIMAASQPWPSMTDLPWSTELLNERLFDRCVSEGLKVSYIQSSYDIDHEQDLHKLLIDLKNDVRPSRQQLLSLTKNILKKDESYA